MFDAFDDVVDEECRPVDFERLKKLAKRRGEVVFSTPWTKRDPWERILGPNKKDKKED